LAKLRIYTDENVDVRVVEGLRRRGVKAFSATEKGQIGVSDMEHFQYASEMQAVIFTHDHHFLEIAKSLMKKESETHWGVIFVEMNKLSVGECIKKLALYAEVLSAEEMQNKIEFL
jgi:predicted nuclease of predicted toxin-antitoxin system